ncbi:epimerase [Larkinella knui]|uniref:NAD-dependent epimerase/dehydratase family protein n=1 Tax=Larkinella knui TaxID=2025310 RepID=A0A3P1CAN3_9BACT|nr:NAD-dependent epimerase/dehydratase family protein [Larkinella knui]RRB10379.1 NAD-dependent epimerase/dehydratase family protein [Larkinella knui]
MKTNGIRAIITGTTGMVGEGVLHECLQHPDVEAVLILNRKPSGLSHPKLKEIIHTDFYDLSSIENQLVGYDACFFCLGVSSVGMSEPDYFKVTYTLTLNVATTLSNLNPAMTFCYISGAGTDSSEKGRSMWARVKGKTENDLLKLPFKQVFNFRPGFIKPTEGLKNTLKMYRYVGWLFPLGRALYPGGFCTLKELGLAMINTVRKGYEKNPVEGKDIIELAKR